MMSFVSKAEGSPIEVRDTRMILRGFIPHAEVGMGHHQFRSLYLGFHPQTGELIVHEGQTDKILR